MNEAVFNPLTKPAYDAAAAAAKKEGKYLGPKTEADWEAEAEERARVKAEAEETARLEAEETARLEAEETARLEAEADERLMQTYINDFKQRLINVNEEKRKTELATVLAISKLKREKAGKTQIPLPPKPKVVNESDGGKRRRKTNKTKKTKKSNKRRRGTRRGK